MTVQQSIRVTPEGHIPTEVEVRLELQKILPSKDFDTSSRNRRFLAFVVEETLASRGDRLKAYNVALAVFDRSSDFDPLTDPIVRIEASRLRRSIEHYYLTAGRADRVHITMPKGSYIAAFAYANPENSGLSVPEAITPLNVEEPAVASIEPAIEVRKAVQSKIGLIGMAALAFAILAAILISLAFVLSPASPVKRKPSILVLPFDDVGSEIGQAGMAQAFTTDTIASLTQSRSLAVFGTEPGINAELSPPIRVDYRFSGSVAQISNIVVAIALLSDANTGQVVWSWRTQRLVSALGPIATQSAMAKEAAEALLQELIHLRGISKRN